MKFEKSTRKNKKYSVITPKGKVVHFGAIQNGIPMEQYKDSTGLGLYSEYDHNDIKRRENYRSRHKSILLKNGKPAYLDKEQPSFYSYNFLW